MDGLDSSNATIHRAVKATHASLTFNVCIVFVAGLLEFSGALCVWKRNPSRCLRFECVHLSFVSQLIPDDSLHAASPASIFEAAPVAVCRSAAGTVALGVTPTLMVGITDDTKASACVEIVVQNRKTFKTYFE